MRKILSILLLFVFSSGVFANEAGNSPEVLDYGTRHAWTTRHEFYLFAGNYYGDSFENSWLAGGEYLFHISRHFGLGANFSYSKADYTENVYYSQAGFFTNDNIYIIDATGMISFPAAYRIGKNVVETDLYVLFGGGTININSAYEPHGFIGGGMKIYMGRPWLALRVELRDTFHTTNKPGGENEFDQDLLFLAGFSFQIPPKIVKH